MLESRGRGGFFSLVKSCYKKLESLLVWEEKWSREEKEYLSTFVRVQLNKKIPFS